MCPVGLPGVSCCWLLETLWIRFVCVLWYCDIGHITNSSHWWRWRRHYDRMKSPSLCWLLRDKHPGCLVACCRWVSCWLSYCLLLLCLRVCFLSLFLLVLNWRKKITFYVRVLTLSRCLVLGALACKAAPPGSGAAAPAQMHWMWELCTLPGGRISVCKKSNRDHYSSWRHSFFILWYDALVPVKKRLFTFISECFNVNTFVFPNGGKVYSCIFIAPAVWGQTWFKY